MRVDIKILLLITGTFLGTLKFASAPMWNAAVH